MKYLRRFFLILIVVCTGLLMTACGSAQETEQINYEQSFSSVEELKSTIVAAREKYIKSGKLNLDGFEVYTATYELDALPGDAKVSSVKALFCDAYVWIRYSVDGEFVQIFHSGDYSNLGIWAFGISEESEPVEHEYDGRKFMIYHTENPQNSLGKMVEAYTEEQNGSMVQIIVSSALEEKYGIDAFLKIKKTVFGDKFMYRSPGTNETCGNCALAE